MKDTAIKQEIIRELERLPVAMQRRVLNFVQALVLSRPKGVPGKQLLNFAGVLGADEAKSMMTAITEGCERENLNEW